MRLLLFLLLALAMALPAQNAADHPAVAPEKPLIPMCSVSGRPTREFLFQFMGDFRRVGITQFLVYPRSGCEVEYLSEEWFQLIQNVLDAAEAHGFTSIWLYDEFNWPSGQCAGRVMAAREDFALQCLYARKDARTGEVSFERKTLKKYPNLLNPEATRLFLQLTHEEYYKRFGKYFGTLIKGIFSDEPSFGYYYDQFETDSDTEIRLPWYPELEDEYRRATGRVLRDDIADHLRDGAPARYRLPCQALLGVRFRKSYFDPIRAWCEEHGILLTGHLMGEHNAQAARYNGDPLLANVGFSLPGMDEIATKTALDEAEWQTLGTVEYGSRHRGGGLAELFALGPGDMQPGTYKQMIWLSALFGVDHYLLAVSQLQAEGNIYKTLWYHPTTPAQTWFDHYDELGETAKQAALFARKPRARVEVEVRYANNSAHQAEYLRQLTRDQRSWRFLREDDAPNPDAIAVANFREDGTIYDERSKQTFPEMSAFLMYLAIHYCQPYRVLNARNTLVRDVFVRPFDDGTCVVLDLCEPDAPPRRLHFRIGPKADHDIVFDLPACGVKVFHADDPASIAPRRQAFDLPDAPWIVSIDRPNVLCPEFDADGCLEMTIAPGTPDAVALLRNYGIPGEATLDGAALSATEPGEGLPQGIAALYRMTAAIALPSGKHELHLAGKKKEYPYLPSVFLRGDFAVAMTRPGEMTLSPLPETVRLGALSEQGFRNFVGKATLTRTVRIPENATALRLETGAHAASVSLGGKALGCRLWAPFEWTIPEELKGTEALLQVTLEIPVAPLFGWERLFGQIADSAHDIPPAGLYSAKWTE